MSGTIQNCLSASLQSKELFQKSGIFVSKDNAILMSHARDLANAVDVEKETGSTITKIKMTVYKNLSLAKFKCCSNKDNYCEAKHPGSHYLCTRSKGHTKDCEAHYSDKYVYARWQK